MSKPIPIEDAKLLAEACGLSQVIIFGWGGGTTHITTYGVTAEDKVQAARSGDVLSKHLALYSETKTVHEDFREEFDAGLFRESLDFLALIRGRNGCNDAMVQQAERILKAAGRGLRQG